MNLEHILNQLNDQQREAVCLGKESALILAGAGSGKTKVLIARVAYLLSQNLANPNQILTVTFTNKASQEMIERLKNMLDDTHFNLRSIWMGTFHSLCFRFLRIYHELAKLPQDFKILDQDEQLVEIKRIYKELNYDPEKFLPKVAQKKINDWKENSLRANSIDIDNSADRIFAEIYLSYEQKMNKEGKVDFAELLLRVYEILAKNDDLCHQFREKFQYILVDEFQDTNYLQYQWLRLLKSRENTIFAVGDDDQSIYGFRGAKSEHMLTFSKDFNANTLIKLEQNYRSQGIILDAANAVIANNFNRLGKNLWTAQANQELIYHYHAFNDRDESEFITNEIKHLIKNKKIPADQIAIIYRTNAQSRILEDAFLRNGIEFKVYGGFRFYQRVEIKQALAYLRLLINSDDRDSFLRVINFPPRGIGAKSLENLEQLAQTQNSSLYEAGLNSPNEKIRNFVLWNEKLKDEIKYLTLTELVKLVIEKSGLIEEYSKHKKDEHRIDNLNELATASRSFTIEYQTENLSEFLAVAVIEGSTHVTEHSEENQIPKKAVQLMTVHSAKGLEFDAVFIIGLEEGLFPIGRSINDELEEERRLMYVAITRAKKLLYLTHADSRMLNGTMLNARRSRFIKEIPDNLVKPLLIKQKNNLSQQVNAIRESSDHFNTKKSDNIVDKILNAPTMTSQKNLDKLFIGQMVEHRTFGKGIITQLSTDRVNINFFKVGAKSLMLEKANLSPCAK